MLPLELHLQQLSKLPPALRYDGKSPFSAWQSEARLKLRELLGMERFEPCALAFRAEDWEDKGTYRRRRISFQSEAGYRVPGWWLEPRELPSPARVMICLQGHSTGMHISLGEAVHPGDSSHGDRDFALHAVEHGFCALVLEQRGFGEAGGKPGGGTDCYQSAMTALLLGRTLLAARVWDVMRGIDVAEQHLLSEPGEFYCMGNSGGGTVTMYAACLEERIAGAMPSCSVCSFDHSIASIHHCSCNFVPGIRRWFDMGDLAGMIAPRPLMVVAGAEDNIFPVAPTRETFQLMQQRYYIAANAPDKCSLFVGEEGHRFYKEAWNGFLELAKN